MDSLPVEIKIEFLSRCDPFDLHRVVQVNREYNSIVMERVRPLPTEEACSTGDVWSIVFTPLQHDWANHGIVEACQHGHLDLAIFIASRGNFEVTTPTFLAACATESLKLVNLLLKEENSRRFLLWAACEAGVRFIVPILVENKTDRRDLNWYFKGACRQGHLELAKMLVGIGADDIFRGVLEAHRKGHLEFKSSVFTGLK